MASATTRSETGNKRSGNRFETVTHSLVDRQSSVWAAALFFFVGGDLLTTFVGLQFSSVEEMGPIAAIFLATYGFEALLALKIVAFSVFVVFWWYVPPPSNVGVPLALVIVGIFLTIWNTFIIGIVLFGW